MFALSAAPLPVSDRAWHASWWTDSLSDVYRAAAPLKFILSGKFCVELSRVPSVRAPRDDSTQKGLLGDQTVVSSWLVNVL